MKAPKFNYVRATSIAHALELLARHGDDAGILAGGQSLMPTLNMRLSSPKLLIDINRLDDLAGIRLDGTGAGRSGASPDATVRIGALARHVEVASSPIVAQHLPLIAAAMPHVAHVAVRNRGTFGGSVALADPAAEMPACLLALQGRIVLESAARGRREVAADDYFHGLYQTSRQPDEMLIEALIPAETADTISTFQELSRRRGDFAMAGVAARTRVVKGTIDDTRLVYFGSEVKPTLGRNAMATAKGKAWNAGTRSAVLAALGQDLDPMDNLFGRPATKLHLQRVLTGRALDEAVAKAART